MGRTRAFGPPGTHRPFLRWPDPRLRAPAAPVVAVDEAVREIWREMVVAMVGMPGIGLAAPQLGIGLRLAVVDATATGLRPLKLANPEILWASEETRAGREASPNLPGVSEEVVRPVSVRARWLDEAGEAQERLLQGDWARSLQHQIDHLDGKLYHERLGAVRRRRLLERYRKLARGRGE